MGYALAAFVLLLVVLFVRRLRRDKQGDGPATVVVLGESVWAGPGRLRGSYTTRHPASIPRPVPRMMSTPPVVLPREGDSVA